MLLGGGISVSIDVAELLKACSIAMPTDQKRNMMNASSNFDIIYSILSSIRENKKYKIHSPGVEGHIGGYPFVIDSTENEVKGYFLPDFPLEEMEKVNRQSIYLDGIENVADGCLVYTDELINKVKNKFNVIIPKKVHLSEAEKVADLLIEGIIKPNVK